VSTNKTNATAGFAINSHIRASLGKEYSSFAGSVFL